MVHVSDLSLQYCVGCGSCYKTGACIYKDDIENLSLSVADADGIIIGSPTYASNVSGQMKVIIDRGHFVMPVKQWRSHRYKWRSSDTKNISHLYRLF